jgi:hypothetical protein
MKTYVCFCSRKWLGGKSSCYLRYLRSLRVENPQPVRETCEVFLREAVITQPDTPLNQRLLASYNSDVTGSISKGQILTNAPELLRHAYIS